MLPGLLGGFLGLTGAPRLPVRRRARLLELGAAILGLLVLGGSGSGSERLAGDPRPLVYLKLEVGKLRYLLGETE